MMMCNSLNTAILGLMTIVTLPVTVIQGESRIHLITKRSSEGTPVKFPDEVKSLADFLQPASETKAKDGVAVKFGNIYNYPNNWPSTKPVAIPFHQYRPGGSAVNFYSSSSHYQGNGFTNSGASGFGQSGTGFVNSGGAGFSQSGTGFVNSGGAGFGQSGTGFVNSGGAGFGQSGTGFVNSGGAGFGQSGTGFVNSGGAGFGQSGTGFVNSGGSSFGQSAHGSTHNVLGQGTLGAQPGGINNGFQGSIHLTPSGVATAGTFPGFQGSIHSTSGTGATFPSGFQSAIAGTFGYQKPYTSSGNIGLNQFSSNGQVFPGWSQQGLRINQNTYGPSNSIFTKNFFHPAPEHDDRPIKFGYYKDY